MDLCQKDYLVVVQCHIVKQRCPGYLCEKAFHERTGGFADYPVDKQYRVINLTCGGCCGRALHRKLTLLKRTLKKKEGIEKIELDYREGTVINDKSEKRRKEGIYQDI